MKKLLLAFLPMAIWAASATGQDPVYRVVYKPVWHGYDFEKLEAEAKNPNEMRVIQNLTDMADASKDLRYELYFTSREAVYKMRDQLVPEEKEMIYTLSALSSGGAQGDVYYRNNEDSTKLRRTERDGVVFLIEEPFDHYDWVITGETKTILGHLCRKATAPAVEQDYSRDRDTEIDREVWFTTDIPLPFGPKGLDGLPGLVLEATMGGKKIRLIATELENDVSFDKSTMRLPTKGTRVTRDEFNRF